MANIMKFFLTALLLTSILFNTMDASSLNKKKCVPCQGGIPALKGDALAVLLKELGNGWQIVDEHHLEKEFLFKNFRKALFYTNQVGELAEIEGHHPDIYLAWGKVKLSIWTHKVDGLTESDFILAAKCDSLLGKRD